MAEMIQATGVSRRKFIALARGAAGFAAMSAMGRSTGQSEYSANFPEIDIEKLVVTENETDVLVVEAALRACLPL